MIVAVLLGLTAYDEYFPLIAVDKGADASDVPVLVGLTVMGQAIGTALAGSTARLSAATIATMTCVAGLFLV
ncbi:MAG: MFS transporter, partial [Actinomycetia bacterium]|nr:MFS transporter [Actinomycetes bacterium]